MTVVSAHLPALGARPAVAAGFTTRPARRRLGLRRQIPFARLLGVVLLLAAWSAGAYLGLLDPRKLSAPWTVVTTGWDLLTDGQLLTNIAVSMQRVATGVFLGILIGTTLALIAGLSRVGDSLVDGVVQLKRSIPTLGLVPLMILWLGIGNGFKIVLIMLAAAVTLYVPAHSALTGIDRRLVELSEIQGVSRFDFIRQVVIPGSLPGFFLGLRLAVNTSWLVLVVVESVNATDGLGKMMQDAQNYGQADVILVALAVYGIFGLACDSGIRILERKVLSWRQTLAD
ncbi:sulfonate transport system permease protein [Nocardia kruczakiae]|uniref:Sulfonate transport system permease protein n=1 Tax=Nocardia kruczakiae TaxID=261477 RepID=A0ABU1XBV2_9NOCA|nr:ABC transporter permease [Nocardia kruczakiae]MDR7168023.1 sulfonate transport system permease protein [Nocardia kruczakiae]